MYHLGVGCYLLGEDLRLDGSNFLGWCLHLRNVLLHNDMLFMIEEPLDKAPSLNATAQDCEEYHETHEIATEVQTLMATSMEPHLRVLFQHRDLYLKLRALKSLFAPKVRALKYDCLSKFFSTKMEENANIDSHLSNMHQIYRRLVDEFECEITDEIGKDVLLHSLPLSYAAFVEGYVMVRNNDNFHQCLGQLKSLKVERAPKKIVKPKGI
jgi:hypothetical protein